MRTIASNIIWYVLAAGGGIFLTGAAHAQQLSMPEKEHVQTIVWIVETATFITAIAIALLVWKISARSKKSKGRKRPDEKNG